MRLITAKEASGILSVSVKRVYEMAGLGIIPVVRMGRQVRFSEDELREWIKKGGSSGRQ